MKTLNPVMIFGARGLGKAAFDIFQSNDVVIYGFLDDDKTLHKTEIGDVSVLGETDNDGFLKLIGQKCDAFVALDNNKERESIVNMLIEKRKVMPINAIHASATISNVAVLGHGNYIGAEVVVNSFAEVGNHCILNAQSLVEYEAKLGDFVQVGAGSKIGAGCVLEQGVFLGAGVIVVQGVTIGKNARIGAGSVVIGDVKAGKTLFGNPAKEIEK
ncbi:MAG: sugar O-acyltransferase, sialic acid O-acetyltransferase NeuD family [Chitinophagaceae bacterium]|nr:sugar O-acyltransferase, sialic acid O-acetyltransferase NeuD family [Chitinophagaceae bacterium]